MITGNEPAFPNSMYLGPDSFPYRTDGMTLRQYYAGLAMQGLCANPHVTKIIQIRRIRELLTVLYYHWYWYLWGILIRLDFLWRCLIAALFVDERQ